MESAHATITDPRRMLARAILALVTGMLAILLAFPNGPLWGIGVAQQQEPQIEIVNPAVAPSGNTRPVISNNQPVETGYHLVAWVTNVPADASVQFRLDEGQRFIGTAQRVGDTDTWHFFWQLPGTTELPDGDYTLRAFLFSGALPDPVADDTQNIEVDRDAEAVTIDYPTNAGPWGVFNPPGFDRWVGVIDFSASEGAVDVRGFYSLSPPGTAPEWNSCGSPVAPGPGTLRCELSAGDVGTDVTAIALVPCDPAALPAECGAPTAPIGAGDAHRAFPYVQSPSIALTIEGNVRQYDAGTCTEQITARVTDQQARPVPRANVDVHATGPLGTQGRIGLRFNVVTTGDLGSDSNQAPDDAHDSTSQSWNCNTNAASGTRGNHVRPGADTRHIESIHTGTNPRTDNDGRFTFRLFNDEPNGSTQITAWVDEDDNDLFCPGDPAAHTSLGWDQAAPAVTGHEHDPGCPTPTPTPTTPTPTPTPTTPTPTPTTPTTPPDDEVVQRGPCAGFQKGSRQPRDDGVEGEVIVGTDGDDTLEGGPGHDIICGLAGNDLIFGRRGGDLIVGGAGHDDLRGGIGPDEIRGNAGSDTLRGGPGRDRLFGGGGRDVLMGGRGPDRLFGGPGRDRLFGGPRPGRNRLHGGSGFDRCTGRPNTIFHRSCNVQRTT